MSCENLEWRNPPQVSLSVRNQNLLHVIVPVIALVSDWSLMEAAFIVSVSGSSTFKQTFDDHNQETSFRLHPWFTVFPLNFGDSWGRNHPCIHHQAYERHNADLWLNGNRFNSYASCTKKAVRCKLKYRHPYRTSWFRLAFWTALVNAIPPASIHCSAFVTIKAVK